MVGKVKAWEVVFNLGQEGEDKYINGIILTIFCQVGFGGCTTKRKGASVPAPMLSFFFSLLKTIIRSALLTFDPSS